MVAGSENDEVRELVLRYIAALDNRDFDAWLALYGENGYYAVLRRVELDAGNNLLLVGEDMKRLRGRVEAGVVRDLRRTVHTVGWVRMQGADLANAAFTLWIDGTPAYAGEYRFVLEMTPNGLRIARCTAIIDNEMIRQPIFLPI